MVSDLAEHEREAEADHRSHQKGGECFTHQAPIGCQKREHGSSQRQDPGSHHHGSDHNSWVVGDEPQRCDHAGANRLDDEGLIQISIGVVAAMELIQTMAFFQQIVLGSLHDAWRLTPPTDDDRRCSVCVTG